MYLEARQQREDVMRITMPDGCAIHLESVGHGDTAVVLLHGIMTSGAVFKRQVDALSGAYRVIMVDLRGFGQSDQPETGYSEENYVSDLKYIIDHLGLNRPIIAGWSMGGTIALAFAATFPGIASRVVLIGTTPCLIQRPDWPHAVPPSAAEQIGQLLATEYSSGVDGFCRMMFPEPNSDDDMDFIRQVMLATSPHVTLACMQNLGGRDFRPVLASIREPISILCGTEDMVCPPEASRFLADTLGGKLTLIPGGGHCAFLTKAEEFNRALCASI